jgi:hypothetical protein
LVYDPRSLGEEAYGELAAEFLSRYGIVLKPAAPPQRKRLILDDIPTPKPFATLDPQQKKKRFWPFGKSEPEDE